MLKEEKREKVILNKNIKVLERVLIDRGVYGSVITAKELAQAILNAGFVRIEDVVIAEDKMFEIIKQCGCEHHHCSDRGGNQYAEGCNLSDKYDCPYKTYEVNRVVDAIAKVSPLKVRVK